jgi:hypothetical protein
VLGFCATHQRTLEFLSVARVFRVSDEVLGFCATQQRTTGFSSVAKDCSTSGEVLGFSAISILFIRILRMSFYCTSLESVIRTKRRMSSVAFE